MTAFETFWDALEEGKLPVAVPIYDLEGRSGLAAQGIPFEENPQARMLLASPSWSCRARGAVLAVNFAIQNIEQKHELIVAVR